MTQRDYIVAAIMHGRHRVAFIMQDEWEFAQPLQVLDKSLEEN